MVWTSGTNRWSKGCICATSTRIDIWLRKKRSIRKIDGRLISVRVKSGTWAASASETHISKGTSIARKLMCYHWALKTGQTSRLNWNVVHSQASGSTEVSQGSPRTRRKTWSQPMIVISSGNLSLHQSQRSNHRTNAGSHPRRSMTSLSYHLPIDQRTRMIVGTSTSK